MKKFKILGKLAMIIVIALAILTLILIPIIIIMAMQIGSETFPIAAFVTAIIFFVLFALFTWVIAISCRIFDRVSIGAEGVRYLSRGKTLLFLTWEELDVSYCGIVTRASFSHNTSALVFYRKDLTLKRYSFLVSEACSPNGWICCKMSEQLINAVKQYAIVRCNLHAENYGVTPKSFMLARKMLGMPDTQEASDVIND